MLNNFQYITDYQQIIEKIFSEIPNIKTNIYKEQEIDIGYDLSLILETESFEQKIIFEMKTSGEPKIARNAVNQLLRYISNDKNLYGVFLAPYITTESANICIEAGIGYIDLSGNCRLSFQNTYIQKTNFPNKFLKRRDLMSLYSPKTERVLRVLLTYPYKEWRTVFLSSVADVNQGLVTQIKKKLLNREWIKPSGLGFIVEKPEQILNEWEKNYKITRNRKIDFYTFLSPSELEIELKSICEKENFIYALSGFSAANYLAPSVRNQKTTAYILGNIEDIGTQLNLKRVNSGANVTLYYPYDNGVFWETQEINQVRITSPIQTYLDLIQSKGRGEEAAQSIFKEVLKKKWLD